MKKGWKKIGKVERPAKSLVFVDRSGNVLSRSIRPRKRKVK